LRTKKTILYLKQLKKQISTSSYTLMLSKSQFL
jgi:hypothetical protein